MFKVGDRVLFQGSKGLPAEKCVIDGVQNTTYRAIGADGDWFTSHHENFEPDPDFVVTTTRAVVGITGRKGHGKDTAAAALVALGYENVKFAGALKEMVRAFLRYVGEEDVRIEKWVEGEWKETPCPHFGFKTTRFVLQTLGTEWGRQMIWSEIWINAFKQRAAHFERVVCSDMRFPNEVEAVEQIGGATLRIERPAAPTTAGSDHPSEALIDTLAVDHTVLNEGSVADLQRAMLGLYS